MKKDIPNYVILLLAVLLWSGEYVRRDFWEPDEGRFALVTREMMDSGDFFILHRQGEVYTHKPPLFFWITALFSLPYDGDIGRVAVRMPSFLGAVMSLWAVSRLAARWFSRAAGWMSVLILASSYLFWSKGGFGQIDALLCGLEMMALYFLFTARDSEHSDRYVAAYIFMGLAVLAKGPVGFLIPWGVYIVSSLIAPEPGPSRKSHFLWGPLITLALPGFWLFMAWMEGGSAAYFRELLFDQNAGRLSGEFGGHVKPFYYFLYYFPLDFLPWSLLLPLSFAALRRAPEYRPGVLRLIAWIGFIVLFFSVSASKRNLYILPAYPAAAMLVAAAVDRWNLIGDGWLRGSFRVAAGLLSLLALAMLVGSFLPHHPVPWYTLAPGGVLLFIGLWISWRIHRKDLRARGWLVAMAGGVLGAFACVGALVYPAIDDEKTPDEMVHVAQELLRPDERIIMYRQHGEMFSLYARRMGFMAHDDERLVQFLQTSRQENHLIISLENNLPELQSIIGTNHTPVRFEMGHKDLVWIVLKNQQVD